MPFLTISQGLIVGVLAIGGVAGKSAQLGLHAWLPAAIEACTPVSALIHAATLVTAGVYLALRIFEFVGEAGGAFGLGGISAATLLTAGMVGLSQTDLKRVIAYSTMSQVGYMVLGCGWGSSEATLFLLVTHAFYKAVLFLSAGVILHGAGNLQDSRQLGGGRCLPFRVKGIFLSRIFVPHGYTLHIRRL